MRWVHNSVPCRNSNKAPLCFHVDSMNPNDVRSIIEQAFKKRLVKRAECKIENLTADDAYGHAAGSPIEEWLRTVLVGVNPELKVFYPNEFLLTILSGKKPGEIQSILNLTWWAPLLVSKKQLREFSETGKISRWQQEGGDLVIVYGSGINDIILLNAKSHNMGRDSRAPNIMSGQRLLEFFCMTLDRADAKEMIQKTNLWFVGISYSLEDKKTAFVGEIFVKDLFKLKLSELPQINFDAAIQIQWHVKDMVETTQDREQFIQELGDTFIQQWNAHSAAKTTKYNKLVSRLKSRLELINQEDK